MATIFRAPLIVRIDRPSFVAAITAVALGTPLALSQTPAQMPFAQTNWPNPAIRSVQQPQLIPRDPARFLEPVGYLRDQPNPRGRTVYPHDPGGRLNPQRWLEPVGYLRDQPNPLRPQPPKHDPGLRPSADYWTVPVGYLRDQPNPLRPQPPKHEAGLRANPDYWTVPVGHLRHQPNPLIVGRLTPETGQRNASLFSLPAPPFTQTNWPNPLRPGRLTPETGQRNGSVMPPPVQAPFYQSQWPNPVRRTPSAQQPGFLAPAWIPIHPTPTPVDFGLIPTIKNLTQLQLQLNELFTTLSEAVPGYGASLPATAIEGRIFVVTPANTKYQMQNGFWVAI